MSEKTELTQDQTIDYLIKAIVRTDSYLNYSNTKSTVILTVSAAFLTLLASNLNSLISNFPEPYALILLKLSLFVIFISLIFAIFLSIKAITPSTGKSKGYNTFSFVDINSNYNLTSYEVACLRECNKENMIKDLSRFHFNLSGSIMQKYKNQEKSINCIITALAFSLIILLIYLAK
ncbi:hypothetical protein ABRP70_10860 [Pectobacterium odoriferum]|uniref:hypothetical protein n=1 Tax=Pectobacterium TaxID=122277 RepID=UPI0032EB00C3